MAKRNKNDLPNPFEQYGDETGRLRASMLLIESNPGLERWIEALHDIDTHGDKSSLVELLKSTGSKRDALLGDLIKRYDLVKKKQRGRPPRPAYTMSNDDVLLAQANATAEDLKSKHGLDKALEYAAAKHGTTKTKLADFRAGRRRSLRKR